MQNAELCGVTQGAFCFENPYKTIKNGRGTIYEKL